MVKGKKIVRLQHSDKSGIIRANGNIPNISVSWRVTSAGCVVSCEGSVDLNKGILIISEKEALAVVAEASFSVRLNNN